VRMRLVKALPGYAPIIRVGDMVDAKSSVEQERHFHVRQIRGRLAFITMIEADRLEEVHDA
jgi:hypothetical protein